MNVSLGGVQSLQNNLDLIQKNLIHFINSYGGKFYFVEDVTTYGLKIISTSDFVTEIPNFPWGVMANMSAIGAGNNGAYVVVKFGGRYKFSKVRFSSWGREKRLSIYVSNDGNTYTQAYTGSHGGVDVLELSLSLDISYRYYKIVLDEKYDVNGTFITGLSFIF